MADINFTLSKKNSKLLIKHVFIGHWILTASKVDRNKVFDDFYDVMLSFAKNYNIMDGIEYTEDFNEYSLTPEKEEELLKFVEKYEEEIFEESLIEKLAIRDAIEKYGIKKLQKMTGKEKLGIKFSEEEKYYKEFEKNGIKRLKIVK